MKLIDPNLLVQYMNRAGVGQAELARSAGVSRQFIHQLTRTDGTGKRTCKKVTGKRIEERLGLLPQTLFLDCKVLPVLQQSAASDATVTDVAA